MSDGLRSVADAVSVTIVPSGLFAAGAVSAAVGARFWTLTVWETARLVPLSSSVAVRVTT